ncbi:hypothetical protein CAPTEDRAFT_188740 [Capitella teleta]|uniref:Uncharacterized protein n=1 Tax=Capitella teleta TaxID=283909 RepID=R7T6M8_CAPTE|nr:hypothetical protein CAPTEDRAFT_188740 [Capitella teleta]|eukprot:ELT89023.1 hypothetical protein CAPTEDRAFT_188740 [Capitella teleta]
MSMSSADEQEIDVDVIERDCGEKVHVKIETEASLPPYKGWGRGSAEHWIMSAFISPYASSAAMPKRERNKTRDLFTKHCKNGRSHPSMASDVQIKGFPLDFCAMGSMDSADFWLQAIHRNSCIT